MLTLITIRKVESSVEDKELVDGNTKILQNESKQFKEPLDDEKQTKNDFYNIGDFTDEQVS